MSKAHGALSVLGLGVDLVHVVRVKNVVDKYGDRFLRRAFTQHEAARFQAMPPNSKFHFLASRWAVKEAVFKAFPGRHRLLFPEIALHTFGGSYSEIAPLNAESVANALTRKENDKNPGSPQLILTGAAQQLALDVGVDVGASLVSISHDGDYAIAQVLLLGDANTVTDAQ
jgi:holo-[acyl-carrier protein] synthase